MFSAAVLAANQLRGGGSGGFGLIGTASAVNNAGAASFAIDLSAIDIEAGDLIVIGHGYGKNNANDDMSVTGYTELLDLYRDSGTWDANMGVSYKIAAGGETSATVSGSSAGGSSGAVAVAAVFCGIDSGTPFDVASVTAQGSNTRPDPGAITPTTSGAIVLVMGLGERFGSMGTAWTITGLDNVLQAASTATSPGARMGLGTFEWTSGAFDPAAWTGGNSDPGGNWIAATMALRPA